AAVGTTRDERTARWVAAHRDLLQVGGVVVAILVLLAADLSWLGLLLVVALVGAFELGVWRLAEGAPPPEDGGPPGPPGAAVEAGV
ncbi:MAG TPA: hypothetical protein VF743_06945, partial [Acidimicrobiales bacterium]